MLKSRMLMAITLMSAAAAPVVAQEDRRPTVMVLDFNNGSFGKDRADYDALGKGISDFLITDLAGNANIRVVDRDKLQQILAEQNLGRDGRISDETIVKIGKILGAHHAIAGGFITDTKGNLVLNARAINTETSKIEYTERVNDKAENFIDAIGKLARAMNSGMKLPDMARRTASAAPATNPGSERATATPATNPPAGTQIASAAPAAAPQRVPYAAVLLYSKALEQKDKGNTREAVVLFRQSLQKFPEFAKAKNELSKIETRPGD